MSGKSIVFGYFFGPTRAQAPRIEDVSSLRADDAICAMQFGDQGLIEGTWPVIGECGSWSRQDWPMPPFIRVDDATGMALLSIYSEDTLEFLEEKPCDAALVSKFPYDRFSGSGAAEIRLTNLLSPISASTEWSDDRARQEASQSVKQGGESAAAPRRIWHYLYLPTREAAAEIAAELRHRGFQTEERLGADDRNWLVLASHRATPTEDEVLAARRSMEALVSGVGGEYDGWEVEANSRND
jgi:hypothetical protein